MIRKISILLIAYLCVWACASQIGPSGGEVDKIPPEIVYTYPADKTVNFNDTYITIEFSEYVDKRSVQEAIFISPSIDGKIEYDWSGKELEIEFEDSLRKDITYSITIGTDVIDVNNRNNMASSYSFTFSTGDEIDNGQIKGTVYDKNALGTMIFAYTLKDSIPDPSTQKPDYLSQVGNKGDYWLRGMAPNKYRLFAIKDEFRDLLYNITDDRWGVTYKDVQITKIDSIISEMDFLLSIEDTTAPSISSITNTDRNHILIEFTEAIDSVRLSAENFYLYDSTDAKRIPVSLVYKDNQKSKNYFICIKDSLVEENANFVIAERIFDKKENLLEYESVSFAVSNKIDTLAPSVKSILTEYPQKIVDFENPYVEVVFDDGIIVENVEEAFTVVNSDSIKLSTKVDSKSDAIKRLTLLEKIKPNQELKLIVNYNFIEDAAGNKKDTTYTNKIVAISELEFSAVSGNVKVDSSKSISLALRDISNNQIFYSTKMTKDNTFNISRVKPGLYKLRAFIDVNNNDKLDKGSIKPFSHSERFIYYPDTLKLNARWPVGDVQIEFKD